MKQMELNKMFKNGGYSRFCDHEYDRNIDGIKRMDVCPKCFYFPCSCLNRLSKDRKSPTPSSGSSWFKSWCHPTLVKKGDSSAFWKRNESQTQHLEGWKQLSYIWSSLKPPFISILSFWLLRTFCLVHFLIDLDP